MLIINLKKKSKVFNSVVNLNKYLKKVYMTIYIFMYVGMHIYYTYKYNIYV